jgi:hypothetical protein
MGLIRKEYRILDLEASGEPKIIPHADGPDGRAPKVLDPAKVVPTFLSYLSSNDVSIDDDATSKIAHVIAMHFLGQFTVRDALVFDDGLICWVDVALTFPFWPLSLHE